MKLSPARPKQLAAALLVVLAGSALLAAPAMAAPPDVAPTYSLTVVARLCPSFTDIQANRARNNLQETYSDLGIDADPPYSDDMAANPISPAREDSANAAGYGRCTAIPGWTFSLGSGLAAYGGNGVGAADHISIVTGQSGTAVTAATTPELNDAGQYVSSDGTVVTDPAQAAQLAGATTIALTAGQQSLAMNNALWVQGGKAHTYADGATNTDQYQLNADQPQFANADGTPLYSFGSLRWSPTTSTGTTSSRCRSARLACTVIASPTTSGRRPGPGRSPSSRTSRIRPGPVAPSTSTATSRSPRARATPTRTRSL